MLNKKSACFAGAFLLGIKHMTRLSAFFVHLCISLCLATLSYVLVYLVWYPDHLSNASGTDQIFLMLVAIDTVLGPCITLVIFNLKKKELKWDLSIVALVQLSALLYGLHAVFVARPTYIVFNVDRFDIAYANDFTDEKLARVKNPSFQSVPLLRPRVIAALSPTVTEERNALLFSSVNGGDDLPQLPQYYVDYLEVAEVVKKRAQSLKELNQFNVGQSNRISALQAKYDKSEISVGYLPLKGKIDHLTVIVDRKTAKVLEFVDLRPWQ